MAGIVVVGLVAVGVLIAGAGAGAETPAERCARETVQWDAAYEVGWHASNPGNPGPPPPNPVPYVCVDPGRPPQTTTPVPTMSPVPTGVDDGAGIEVRGGRFGDVGTGTDLDLNASTNQTHPSEEAVSETTTPLAERIDADDIAPTPADRHTSAPAAETYPADEPREDPDLMDAPNGVNLSDEMCGQALRDVKEGRPISSFNEFVRDGEHNSLDGNDLDAALHTKYSGESRAAMRSWDGVGGASVAEDGLGSLSDVTIKDVNSPGAEWDARYIPSEDTIYLNTYYLDHYDEATRQSVIAHEIGHAVGLSHTGEGTSVMDATTPGRPAAPTNLDRALVSQSAL